MPLSDEEFQRYKEAFGGQQPEQEEPERFESGRESADDGMEGLRQIAGSAPVQAATRTLQNVAMPIYNTLYDAVAGATGGGVDMEVPTTTIGDDGEFEYGTARVRGVQPLFGGAPQPQPALFGGGSQVGLIPTRNYHQLQEDGSYKLIQRDAPLPFLGHVDRASSGNDLIDMTTDIVGNMLQLVMIARGGKGQLATPAPAGIARLASAANQPKPLSTQGLQKAGAVFAKGMTEYAGASFVQSVINAGGDPKAATALGAFVKPLQINPDDPLLVRQSKALAEELFFNTPMGGALELGFYGLNKVKKAAPGAPAYAKGLRDKAVNVAAATFRFMRAEVLGETIKAAPEVVTDPQVKVVTAASRREERALNRKLAEQQRIEGLKDAAGYVRPEQFDQPQLKPLSDEEVAVIQERARQELETAVQQYETEVAKIETTVKPGVSEEPTARPELQRPDYEQVATIPRQEIFAAPKALQYKAAGLVTPSGASGVLSDAQRYNPNLAGTLLAWKDAAGEIDPANPGRIYAVDGHNRLDLANRLGYEGGVNVQFIDAPDVATARTIGAMSNIANRNGTPTDAAKVLRDTGMTVDEMAATGVAPSGSVARIAIGLRDLPQDLFDKVVAGDISEEIGSAIGKGGLPEQVQRDILSAAQKKRWGVERVREAVAIGGEANVTTEIDTGVLPGLGLEELTSSDFQALVDVRIQARSLLKTEIRALGAVTDSGKASTLVDAGNVLDVEQSKTARQAAIYGERVFNQMAGMTGPLNDLLKEMAGQVGKGKTAGAIVRANSQTLRDVLDSYVNNRLIPQQAARKEVRLQEAQAKVDAEVPVAEPVRRVRTQATEAETRSMVTDLINKSLANLPPEKRTEIIERLVQEKLNKGAITSNPSPIGGRTIEQLPDAELPEPPKPEAIDYGIPKLPRYLEGAAPRAGNTVLKFESDVDRAIYIVTAKGKPSKKRNDFAAWLDSLGLENSTIQGTGIRLREQLKAARIYNNPQAPKELPIPDTKAWEEGGYLSGELSVDLPDFDRPVSGRLGEDLATELRLSQADRTDLIMEIQSMVGDIDIQFRDEIPIRLNLRQAKNYGVSEGTRMDAAGIYRQSPDDPAKDSILLAEMMGGKLIDFDIRRQVAFHEAFHAMERRLLNEKDMDLLVKSMPEIRQFAYKHADALVAGHLKKRIASGQLADHEVRAVVFQAMSDTGPGGLKELLSKEYTWAEPLRKLLQVAERVGNWLKGRGYRTWNDVYEMAASGELAGRAPRTEDLGTMGRMTAQLAVPDVDPEEAAKKFSGKRLEGDELIQAGEIDIDEALVNETRRGISRSGNTRYIAKNQEQLASSYYALRRVLKENMEKVTGIPEFREADIAQRALDHLNKFDGPQEVLEGIERLLTAANPEAGDHVVGLTALQMMRDNAQNSARLHSIEYENAVDPAFKAKELEGMVMAFSEMNQLDRQYRRLMRVSGQMLRVGKNKPSDAALEMDLPPLQQVRLNGTADRIESVLAEGFTEKTVTPGLMGDGIYMTTDASTKMDWGDSQAVGSLTSDIKIMDLYSANKRIQDLLRELDLGAPLADGKGIKLSDEQIDGIRDYAAEKGFDGIRYAGDYKPGDNPFDEIVIFNKETADRVIDSDVATDPEIENINTAVGEGVSSILREPMQPLEELFNEELLEKIKAGSDDPEVKEVGDILTQLVRADPATQMHAAEFMEKGGKGSVDRNYLYEAYRGAILFSGQTWWKMGLGTAYRTLTTPIAEGAGHVVIGAAQKLAGKDKEAYLSMRRASLAPLQFQQYAMNVPNAFRMALTAIKENRSFGRAGYTSGQDFDETMQAAFNLRQTNSGSQIVQEVDFSNPNSGNWVGHLNHVLAIATSPVRQGGRVASGIDTFFNYMVGPATNMAKNLDEQLTVAETQYGLTGRAAYDWAWTEAMAKTKRQFVDVHLANGTVIKDGAITGSAAEEALDFINFSDNLRITKEDIGPRTYERGVAVARERGLTDPNEIHEVALAHMESVPLWAKDFVRVTNMPSRTINKIHRNAVGKWFFPIMKTPVNILKSGARAFGGGVFVDTWWKDMLSENPATRARAIGEMAVGWGTYVLINQLIDGGLIEVTGANPGSYERSQFNEIVRSPGFSVRINLPGGPTDWHSVQAFDTLTTSLSIVGRVRSDQDLLTEQQLEEQSAGAIMLLGQVAHSVGIDGMTRDVFGSLDELLTVVQTLFNNENEGDNFGERFSRSASRLTVRKLSSFVPAFLRNLQNDATEMRFRADRTGYVPQGPFEYIGDLLNQMRRSVEVQVGGLNNEPVVLDPITGFPIYKASSSDAFMGEVEGNKWITAALQQALPHAAFKSVRGADYMPVHTELAMLQRHTPKNIVFFTRSNLSAKVDGRTVNLANMTSRGLRVINDDMNAIIGLATSTKINGKTLEQALNEKISSRQYQALSPRRSGIEGEEQDSRRLLEIYKVFKEYRQKAVRLWLETTSRGNEFMQAHEAQMAAEAEQDLIDYQRRENAREEAEMMRRIVEEDERQSGPIQQGGRLEQEVGSFTRAIGVG